MPIVHLQGIQPVHQLRQALRPLFEKRFKGRDKFQLPAFRNATAETVVVGGMMPAPLLEKVLARLPPLYQSVRGRYLPAMRVKMGMTGTDTAALGAAALPIFDEFNPQFQALMK